jgi:hypothetical protein
LAIARSVVPFSLGAQRETVPLTICKKHNSAVSSSDDDFTPSKMWGIQSAFALSCVA